MVGNHARGGRCGSSGLVGNPLRDASRPQYPMELAIRSARRILALVHGAVSGGPYGFAVSDTHRMAEMVGSARALFPGCSGILFGRRLARFCLVSHGFR